MIRLQLSKQLPSLRLELDLELGRFLTVITGPSGSGKSTLLKMIAGLVTPDEGLIQLGPKVLFDPKNKINLAPHLRKIGYVFQENRLFPHRSVKGNLLFGAPKGVNRAQRLAQVVELLGIEALLGRHPAGLSGGEKQRVSIGRALLSEPELLLMDEPLSSLDPARKAELLPYIEQIGQELGTPILYVTHDENEALRLAQARIHLISGRAVPPPSRPEPSKRHLRAL